MKRRTYCKYEIADLLEVSVKTLSNYANELYYDRLKPLGYTKHQKKFTPAQVECLKNILGF